MADIPFGTPDWASVSPTEHRGEAGMAYWRTRQFADVRVRLVEYTPGYVADPAEAHRSSTMVGAKLFIVD